MHETHTGTVFLLFLLLLVPLSLSAEAIRLRNQTYITGTIVGVSGNSYLLRTHSGTNVILKDDVTWFEVSGPYYSARKRFYLGYQHIPIYTLMFGEKPDMDLFSGFSFGIEGGVRLFRNLWLNGAVKGQEIDYKRSFTWTIVSNTEYADIETRLSYGLGSLSWHYKIPGRFAMTIEPKLGCGAVTVMDVYSKYSREDNAWTNFKSRKSHRTFFLGYVGLQYGFHPNSTMAVNFSVHYWEFPDIYNAFYDKKLNYSSLSFDFGLTVYFNLFSKKWWKRVRGDK